MRSNSKLLTHVDSEIELNMIKGLFEDNKIAILIEKQGTGAYLAVHSGFNFQGTDVYVAENDYDKATELLEVLQNIKPTEEEIEPWEEGYKTKYENKKRKYAFVAVIIPVIIFLLVIIGSIIVKVI